MRNQEKDYYNKLMAQNKYDMKKNWKILNKIIKKSTLPTPKSEFKWNNKTYIRHQDTSVGRQADSRFPARVHLDQFGWEESELTSFASVKPTDASIWRTFNHF